MPDGSTAHTQTRTTSYFEDLTARLAAVDLTALSTVEEGLAHKLEIPEKRNSYLRYNERLKEQGTLLGPMPEHVKRIWTLRAQNIHAGELLDIELADLRLARQVAQDGEFVPEQAEAYKLKCRDQKALQGDRSVLDELTRLELRRTYPDTQFADSFCVIEDFQVYSLPNERQSRRPTFEVVYAVPFSEDPFAEMLSDMLFGGRRFRGPR